MIAFGELLIIIAVLLLIYGVLYLTARVPMAKGAKKIITDIKKDDKKIAKL